MSYDCYVGKTKMNEGCWHSREEFYFDVVGNFEPKKFTPNCNALANSIIYYFGVSYFQIVFRDSVLLFCLQKNAVESLERAHNVILTKKASK